MTVSHSWLYIQIRNICLNLSCIGLSCWHCGAYPVCPLVIHVFLKLGLHLFNGVACSIIRYTISLNAIVCWVIYFVIYTFDLIQWMCLLRLIHNLVVGWNRSESIHLTANVSDQLLLPAIESKLKWPVTWHLWITFNVWHCLLRRISSSVDLLLRGIIIILLLLWMLPLILIQKLHAIFNVDIFIHWNRVKLLKNRPYIIDLA